MAVTDRNDLFSGDILTQNAYPAPLEKIPELQKQSPIEGFYRGYLRPMIPGFLKREPALSDEFKKLQRDATAISQGLNRARSLEDQVIINGRALPGIFVSFSMGGGIRRVTVKAKSRSDKKVAGVNIAKQFSIDAGDKPVTGSISFIMLDDYFSTAKSKTIEFFRIITNWTVGEVQEQEGRDRIFTMQTFLTGNDFPGALNFSRIKIISYGLEMDNEGIEGAIVIRFTFEQYERTGNEGTLRKPKTPAATDGGGTTEVEEAEDLPEGMGTFTP